MREREIEYWNKVASQVFDGGKIRDNWVKRERINKFLSCVQWYQQTVLEIGVGAGISAMTLAVSCGRQWTYTGVEMSPAFIQHARNFCGLHVVQGDVLSLPDGKFTRIIALDSLEHVRKEDRPEGFKAIVDRMAKDAYLLINMPCHRSSHDEEFDHGFDLRDLAMFEDLGLHLVGYELYRYVLPTGPRLSAFVTLHT